MDDQEDDQLDIQGLIDADFPDFGHATFGPALAPNGDDDGDPGMDHGSDHGSNDGIGIGSTDGGNPSHTVDNDFFYIKGNVLYPKTDAGTLTGLKKLAVGAYNIPLLHELFEEPEG